MVRLIYFCLFLTLLFNCSQSFKNLSTQSQFPSPFFRRDYHYIESVENFYKIHIVPRTWVDAKARCEWEGTTLYYPTSEAEANAVNAYVKEEKGFNNYWIGITSLLSEGIFLTIDGLSMSEVHAKWSRGEPNGLGDDEKCVEYYGAGLNDVKCSNKRPYICKKTLASLEWNTECQMPNADYIHNETLGKCYKLHISPKTWTEAYAICASELSYLAVIDSQDEADFFVAELSNSASIYHPGIYVNTYHLGIHNKFGHGWRTVKDTPLDTGYRFWGEDMGMPNEDTGACGGMSFIDGRSCRFHSAACDQRYSFICEHDLSDKVRHQTPQMV